MYLFDLKTMIQQQEINNLRYPTQKGRGFIVAVYTNLSVKQ